MTGLCCFGIDIDDIAWVVVCGGGAASVETLRSPFMPALLGGLAGKDKPLMDDVTSLTSWESGAVRDGGIPEKLVVCSAGAEEEGSFCSRSSP